MALVKINDREVDRILTGAPMVKAMGTEARKVQGRVRAPSQFRVWSRAGYRGRGGPFGQVIVSGPGAVAWEYGGRNTPPAGQLRGALR